MVTINVVGRDITKDFQAVANNPKVSMIKFSGNASGSEFIINGTVNIPRGKTILFDNGNKIVGTGTINGGIYEVNPHYHIFDTSITVNPEATAYGEFSVRWYGAGKGGDSYPQIQKSIDTCLRNNIRTCYFPHGYYSISKPLIVRNKAAAFCSIKLLGETQMWQSVEGSTIYCEFTDTFAIGCHLNKGTIIDGFTIFGKFQPQGGGWQAFFNTPFDKWGSGARDSRYSPFSGIAIDPFTNYINWQTDAKGLPSDGGYPGLEKEYGIAPDRGSGGSTGVQIRNCVINGFVCGVSSSVNGQTLNEEELTIDFVDFTNCKTNVAGGQAQEKNNNISNIATWGGTHTVFSQGVYGQPGHAGFWTIDKVNLAGAVVQVVASWAAAWFPMHATRIFAESLGRFGFMGTQMNASVTNSHFDFQEPQYGFGYQPIVQAQGMIKFMNCVFRYYNGAVPGYPMVVSGGIYDTCTFGGTPIDVAGTAEFYNCGEDGYGIGTRRIGDFRKNIKLTPGENIVTHNRYGDFSVSDEYSNPNPTSLAFQGSNTFIRFSVETETKQIVTNGGEAFTFTSSKPEAYFVNQLIEYKGDTGVGWGVINKIDGNIITVVGGTQANGGFNISGIYPNHASIAFTGDITGPNEISNIKMKWGIPSGGVGFAFPYGVSGFKILSYDATANKFKTIGQLPQFSSYNFK